jgi:hypothetical protein
VYQLPIADFSIKMQSGELWLHRGAVPGPSLRRMRRGTRRPILLTMQPCTNAFYIESPRLQTAVQDNSSVFHATVWALFEYSPA